MPKILLFVFFAGTLVSCQKFENFQENDPSYVNEGFFVKSSLSKLDLNNLRLEKPRAIVQVSDMFVDEKYLYVAEYAKGIHVFKNPNSVKPEAVAFINVPALRKFTVKDGFLISDSGNDLISFKITDLDLMANRLIFADSLSVSPINFGLVNRKSDLFTFPNYPIERNVYFECPDSVDFVVEWEKKVIAEKLNCYR
jgi:hypothetical protein